MVLKHNTLWLWSGSIIGSALWNACIKFTPRYQLRNPVMFSVYIGALLIFMLWIQALLGSGEADSHYILWIDLGLWFTVYFSNFAECMVRSYKESLL